MAERKSHGSRSKEARGPWINQLCHLSPAVKQMRSVHDACETLEALDVNSGTGPDLLPALILQYYCAKECSAPVFKLLERILDTVEWPRCWREHWVAPIYKRHTVFQPKAKGVCT